MDYKLEQIKSDISMLDILSRYGFAPNKKGFIPCPFHTEKTASCRIYEKSYYCFGCGRGGDVIKFVSKLFDLDYKETIIKIDYDFNLNLGVGREMTMREKATARKRQLEFQAECDLRIAKDKKRGDDYWIAFDNWKRYDDNKRLYAPKNQDAEPNPLFLEALQNIEYSLYLLDLAEIERMKIT